MLTFLENPESLEKTIRDIFLKYIKNYPFKIGITFYFLSLYVFFSLFAEVIKLEPLYPFGALILFVVAIIVTIKLEPLYPFGALILFVVAIIGH